MLLGSLVRAAIVLTNLRQKLTDNQLDAYIVPYGGQHLEERSTACDARIWAVSGFDGSSASVIVTQTEALLWTDGRYYLQAQDQLDLGWTLMKDGEPETPTQSQWLNNNTDIHKIGVDSKTYPKSSWDKMVSELNSDTKTLESTLTNYVDDSWADRPPCPSELIHKLPDNFSGKNVSSKLKDVRELIAKEEVSTLVVSELDEVAWLLNLRGKDLPQASVFFGFIILDKDKLEIFVNSTNIPIQVQNELIALGASFSPYADVGKRLLEIQAMPETTKILVSKYANSELANSIVEAKRFVKLSPIILMKSLKNPTEVAGMRSAHLKDSAAIIAFLSWLEIQLDKNELVDEISGPEKLRQMRRKGANYVDQSFNTISGFGPNGAIIHYRPTEKTNVNITKDGMYLLDSGGLYWDGTTDITRTVHFGNPSAEQKDRFTRVLKGHIAIATATFPRKTTGNRLDSFARKSLWDVGLDYKHGTGHGIGHYLNVHEGPQKVSFGVAVDDSGLEENMFISNEPGFYKDGEYGIRIENIVRIAKSEDYDGFLEIETVSFVPIQTKLIDLNIMTDDEINWVNDYHKECREKVLAHMNANPGNEYFDEAAKDFLTRETEPISRDGDGTGGSTVSKALLAMIALGVVSAYVA